MNTEEIMRSVLAAVDMTQGELAKLLGQSASSFNQKVKRETLRMKEFLEILDKIGVDLQFKVRETGESVEICIRGHGRRVRKMEDHRVLDTGRANAISNSFYADGEHEYGPDGTAQELYLTKDGIYFMASYNEEDPKKDKIQVIQPNIAAMFIEKYGTELEKKNQ